MFDKVPVEVELTAVNDIIAGYRGQFLVTDDIDALNDKILAECKDAGLDKIVEEANRQLQAWLAG